MKYIINGDTATINLKNFMQLLEKLEVLEGENNYLRDNSVLIHKNFSIDGEVLVTYSGLRFFIEKTLKKFNALKNKWYVRLFNRGTT